METIISPLGTLLITLFALLPDVLGDRAFGLFVGRRWLEKDFDNALRVVGYSVAGLLVHAMAADRFGFPAPVHVLSSTPMGASVTADQLSTLALGYFGHCLTSAVIGVVTGLVSMGALKAYPSGIDGHRGAWEQFVRDCVRERWVVVRLRDGGSYVGILVQTDTPCRPDHRDLILKEPAV